MTLGPQALLTSYTKSESENDFTFPHPAVGQEHQLLGLRFNGRNRSLRVTFGLSLNQNSIFLLSGFSVGADSPRAVGGDSSNAVQSMDLSDSIEMEDSMPRRESKAEKRERIDSISFDNDDDFCCLNQMILDL